MAGEITDDAIIDAILAREGGFTDLPADRGGPTNRGITLRDLSIYLAHGATVAELKALTAADARAIYQSIYIKAPRFDKIGDPALRAFLVDAGVNHGPGTAIRWLQTRLGVKADGVLGPITLGALARKDAAWVRSLRAGLAADRIRHYGEIVAHDPTQLVFLRGWLARGCEFVETLV